MEEDKDRLEKHLKRFEEAKKLDEEARKSLEEHAKMAEDMKKMAEAKVKQIEDAKKAAEEAVKMTPKTKPFRRDSANYRIVDLDSERLRILLDYIGSLEKQREKREKSVWKRQLLTGIISTLVGVLVGGILSTILFPRVNKLLTAQSLKPNKDRCAIVYLKDDPYSKEIAYIIRDVLDSVEIEQITKYRLVSKDSSWYTKFYTGDARENRSIELSYNDKSNTWLVDASNSTIPAPVEQAISRAIYKDKAGNRDTLLPLSEREMMWKVETVRPRGQMPSEAGLTRNAINIVSPPSSWWKEEE